MSKSVLISIQPYWCFLIIAKEMGWEIIEEKTIEVRKNFPQDTEWNKKVIIYCSKDKKSFNRIPKEYQPLMEKFLGKIVGVFICNKIEEWEYFKDEDGLGYDITTFHNTLNDTLICACLTYNELICYGNGKNLYGWHISDLKIYDKPKEISEFSCVGQCCQWNKIEIKENVFGDYVDNCYDNSFCKTCCEYYNHDFGQCDKPYSHFLKRPPQSWCYVEDIFLGKK